MTYDINDFNTFTIERGSDFVENVVLTNDDGHVVFNDVAHMSAAELGEAENLEEFIWATLEATDSMFGETKEDTSITLVDEDKYFIWSIFTHYEEDDELYYDVTDWRADGKRFKYSDEECARDCDECSHTNLCVLK